MPTCFVSYASFDRIMVESFANTLRSYRYDVWIDVEDIAGGDKWELAIVQAIEKSDVCLVIITPDSIGSEWVRREVAAAKDRGMLIVPLVMRAVPIPSGLEMIGLQDVQFIDFVRYGLESGTQQLLKVLPTVSVDRIPAECDLAALIIEDMPAQQLAIRQVLKTFGYEVSTASEFESALELIREESFNLVTLDMQLDVMDPEGQHGMLLLDELRTYQKQTPVIIISGLDWTERQIRDFLRKYGAFDYLKKPFAPDELRKMIQEALDETSHRK